MIISICVMLNDTIIYDIALHINMVMMIYDMM